MSDSSASKPAGRHAVRPKGRLLAWLFAIPVLMFGFGFAMVPLYDVLCDITGINGKTGRISVSALGGEVDESRLIKVQFITQVSGALPWEFEAEVHEMYVHPGQLTEANFTVRNNGQQTLVGQAIPSVTPGQASLYFNKTECFCFSQQVVKAGEFRDMPLRFVIDPRMPRDIEELTLSYTFFETRTVAGSSADGTADSDNRG